ncbi:hypothetical protein EIN_206460 [Entamoeba invadens IP1]|uniref:Uncharacterized protein n=1 Tax=Entamoeba invadens IP1 TaxID=370355 RepID=A0A0A1U9P7_ENTIV|nr:hypothetical protein EIN_206460 [Entamoeba invadens IP1]ELP91649.1 hypothetical protein EIN_206460 [Entamoeba invadens IP1]|eukprot:XP_004258420.1 hypothetical protein EIN_206460 [Entamoeba invadens IP1]
MYLFSAKGTITTTSLYGGSVNSVKCSDTGYTKYYLVTNRIGFSLSCDCPSNVISDENCTALFSTTVIDSSTTIQADFVSVDIENGYGSLLCVLGPINTLTVNKLNKMKILFTVYPITTWAYMRPSAQFSYLSNGNMQMTEVYKGANLYYLDTTSTNGSLEINSYGMNFFVKTHNGISFDTSSSNIFSLITNGTCDCLFFAE